MKTSQLDEVDRQLLHALMVAPRASFRVLASALGVSDQTIARRYKRLVETADLRVAGLIHGPRAGWVDWIVRLQVAPGSAQRIADTLAQRPDTRWVRLYSGGTEIVCTLQARTPEQRNALFLRGLPGSRHVTGITAQSILHEFSPVAYLTYTRALAPEQLAALAEAPAITADRAWTPSEETETLLRPEDDPLLAELTRDGRAPIADLAAATHWHESTVRRRIEELKKAGLLYFDVDLDESVVGISANVMLWLKIEPAFLDAAGRAIAAHPEIPFAGATTGATNLAASAVFRDTRELYAYLTTRLRRPPRPPVGRERPHHRHRQANFESIISNGPRLHPHPHRLLAPGSTPDVKNLSTAPTSGRKRRENRELRACGNYLGGSLGFALLGVLAAVVYRAADAAFTASLHITALVAALIFAALAILILTMRQATTMTTSASIPDPAARADPGTRPDPETTRPEHALPARD